MQNKLQILFDEHENISRMLHVIRKMSINVLRTGNLDINDFKNVHLFIKEYADNIHHGKEENILFTEMKEKLDGHVQELINNGMLVEHELGRAFNYDLGQAIASYQESQSDGALLDILVSCNAYSKVLKSHIQKENAGVFKLAERSLDKKTLENLNISME